MSLWQFLREYRHVGLLAVVSAVYAVSWWLRRRRPDVEALKKLAMAVAGLAPLLFVLVFLVIHRSSDLGGGAEVMTILAALGAIERFHAVLDAWKALVGQPTAQEGTVELLASARSGERELVARPPLVDTGKAEEEVKRRTLP
jgi:hypothetical protein